MQSIIAEPINAEAFAPYGELLVTPAEAGRLYYDASLANARPHARASLAMTLRAPAAPGAIAIAQMERHRFSSQSFLPLDVARYLVVVAPHGDNDQPDQSRIRAFVVPGQLGITYRADTWHCMMTAFDRPARFAVMMWLDGTSDDEEFVDLPIPLTVTLLEGN